MTIAHRLTEIRAHLGLNQTEMAERVGVKRDSWRRYEGGDTPTGEPLERLARLGFSVDWILTGLGSMRGSVLADVGSGKTQSVLLSVDMEFMGRVFDAVAKLYKEENQRLAPVDQGRIAAELYNDVASIEDEAERRGALRYAIEQKRKELRTPPTIDASSKRSA